MHEEVQKFLKENQRKGGESTKNKHGKEHYVAMGKKGGSAAAKKRTSEQYTAMVNKRWHKGVE